LSQKINLASNQIKAVFLLFNQEAAADIELWKMKIEEREKKTEEGHYSCECSNHFSFVNQDFTNFIFYRPE
jgi:hypothetical protein